jgi:Family of unknown function (DUF5990)
VPAGPARGAALGTLRVRVVCTDLPGTCFRDPQDPARPVKDPVFLGIQRGKETIEQVPGDTKTVTFIPEFRVERKKDGTPNYLGPFAQGTADDRFFYLAWGVKDPKGRFEMFRRLKVRLGHLSATRVERACRSGEPVTVRLRLTDAKGGPLCATPRPPHIEWER